MARLIREHCIPLTHNHLRAPESDHDARFWEQIYTRLGSAGQDVVAYFLCTPGGRTIPVQDGNVAGALAAWARLPAHERRPARSHTESPGLADLGPRASQPPPGGLILRISQRVLERDERGTLRAPGRTMLSNAGLQIPAQPNGDFLWLTAAEWRSLQPEAPRPGFRGLVPPAIRDRIFRFHLADGAKHLVHPWRREDLRSGAIVLTVEDVTLDRVRLRLDGAAVLMSDADPARAESGYRPRLIGLIEYDPRQAGPSRFDFVALGECWGNAESSNPDLAGPYRHSLGIAFEMVSGRAPGDRLPPFWFWQNKATDKNRAEYFGAGR